MSGRKVEISHDTEAYSLPSAKFAVFPDDGSEIPFAVGAVSDAVARDWEAEAEKTGKTIKEVIAERYSELP